MNKALKDFIYINVSSAIFILLGIALNIFLPLLLEIEQYANLRKFTFYIGFASIFHLGVVDAIIYKYKSLSKDDSKLVELTNILFFNIVFTIIIIIILTLISYYIKNLYLFYASLFILPSNIMGILFSMLTINKKFSILSMTKVIPKFVQLLFLFAYYLLGVSNINFVILAYFVGAMLVVIILLTYYKKEIFKSSFKLSLFSFLELIKIGFPLVLAYFLLTLALGLDRIFLEIDGYVDEYAYYAFAYSMVVVLITVMKSSSPLLVPYLTNASEKNKNEAFNNISIAINLLMVVAGLSMLLLPFFLELILPEYTESALSFYLLFPTVMFQLHYSLRQRPSLIINNNGSSILGFNLVLVFTTLIFNIIIQNQFKTYYYYAIGSILSFSIFYIIVELKTRNTSSMQNITVFIILFNSILFAFESISILAYSTIYLILIILYMITLRKKIGLLR